MCTPKYEAWRIKTKVVGVDNFYRDKRKYSPQDWKAKNEDILAQT